MRCMHEQEIECRLVIPQNKKCYLSKVILRFVCCLLDPVPVFRMFSRAQYFSAFCLRRGFFWEWVVLFCLQSAKKLLFAICKDTLFALSKDNVLFAECEDIFGWVR